MSWRNARIAGSALLLSLLVLGVLSQLGTRTADAAGPPPPALGDFNLDGAVDLQDLAPYVLAATDAAAWQNHFDADAATLLAVGDFDSDGEVTLADRAGFLELIAPGQAPPNAGLALMMGAEAGVETDGGDPDGFVDLDIDSDNTSDPEHPFPDRSPAEDAIEDDADKPGKVVGVNDDDDDASGIVDLADPDPVAGENDLRPMLLEVQTLDP